MKVVSEDSLSNFWEAATEDESSDAFDIALEKLSDIAIFDFDKEAGEFRGWELICEDDWFIMAEVDIGVDNDVWWLLIPALELW